MDMKNIWKLMAIVAIFTGLSACKKEKAPTDISGGCEAVDLGLSVKWASYNVGAKNEDGRGWYSNYRFWGQSVLAVTFLLLSLSFLSLKGS